MASKYISDQIFSMSINLENKYINGDINNNIIKLLKKKHEGYCNSTGFVLSNSLELIHRSAGEVKTINNMNYVIYSIKYKARVLSVSNTDVLEVIVESITKMGAICYLRLRKDDSIKESPLIAIVPKEYFISSDDLEGLHKNDKLNVKIEIFRIKYKSNNIQVVARPT